MADTWHTARLLLRRFTPADADHLIALDSDPAVMQFLTGGTPTSPTVIIQQILPRFISSATQPAPCGYWAALDPTTGGFLGWFCLRREEHDTNVAHLGYRLCRARWGQGYATEGARALITRAFTGGGLHCIVATTYQDNLAPRRVLEKAGLTLVRAYRWSPTDLLTVGTFQVAASAVWDGDELEYAIDREAWERQEPALS